MNDNDIAEIIANANPVPEAAIDELRHLSPAETELCEAIMSLPTFTPTNQSLTAHPAATAHRSSQRPSLSPDVIRPRSHNRRWTILGAASVAAALIALFVATLPGGERSNIAFAEWVSAPQPVSPTERAAIETTCADITPGFEGLPSNGALIDRRGSIAALTADNGDDRLTCAVYLADGTWHRFGAAVEQGGDPLQPGLMRGSGSDAEINVVVGFAPDAVTVEVDAPDVPTATATVVDGRYIVWLPQSFDWTESVDGIQIRYLDAAGETLQTIDLCSPPATLPTIPSPDCRSES